MNIKTQISKTINNLYNILEFLNKEEKKQRAKQFKIVDFQSFQTEKEIETMLAASKGNLRQRPNGTFDVIIKTVNAIPSTRKQKKNFYKK